MVSIFYDVHGRAAVTDKSLIAPTYFVEMELGSGEYHFEYKIPELSKK